MPGTQGEDAADLGLPVVGLATTELVTVIENGNSGFIDTDVQRLIDPMRMLLSDPEQARRIGAAGRKVAQERFDIRRFARDWEQTFALVTGKSRHTQAAQVVPTAAAGGAA